MLQDFLGTLAAAIVWVVANVVYLDLKRKGVHGFTRFVAFWAGTPTTWITFFAVQEGSQPTFHVPETADGDDVELLQEIRRDRIIRGGDRDPLLADEAGTEHSGD